MPHSRNEGGAFLLCGLGFRCCHCRGGGFISRPIWIWVWIWVFVPDADGNGNGNGKTNTHGQPGRALKAKTRPYLITQSRTAT